MFRCVEHVKQEQQTAVLRPGENVPVCEEGITKAFGVITYRIEFKIRICDSPVILTSSFLYFCLTHTLQLIAGFLFFRK